MKLNLQDITFIIVSFRAEKVIHSCIDSLPENSKIIIIENSNNINLKKDLETKYDNIEVIINENQGMGASNNIGITASASSPEILVKKLLDNLKKNFEISINEAHYQKENIYFKVPQKLKN